jgi:RNA polymerase sigma factor (sigma-70 family)
VAKNAKQRSERRFVTTGWSEEAFETAWVLQGGKCRICSIKMLRGGTKGQSVSADHSHATGKTRGLLCNCCNQGLGYFKDSVDLLQKAAGYLERYSWVHDFEIAVNNLAHEYVVDGVEEEDLRQEGYLAVLEATKTWCPTRPDHGTFRKYALTCIRQALRKYVEANSQYALTDYSETEAAMQEVHFEMLERTERAKRSSATSWEDISRLRVDGHTFEEIGKRLGKSTHAVMMAWSRAKKHLAKDAA